MSGKGSAILAICDETNDRFLRLHVSSNITLSKFKQLVSKHLKLGVDEFELHCDDKAQSINFDSTKLAKVFELCAVSDKCDSLSVRPVMGSLKDANFENVPEKNRLVIKYTIDHSGIQPDNGATDSKDEGSFIGLNCIESDQNQIVPYTPLGVDSVPATHNLYRSHSAGFVGLVNSGMTCYMNSLLQTLYMTPEFRNALYCWRFEGSSADAATSIPYQLQRLFVQLQTSSSLAISTSGVTTSFGWRSCDIFQQQDIHELCRVLFDALEKKLGAPASLSDKRTSDKNATYNLINRLYQGERSDYVRCLHCNRVSWRPDTFLDIQVPLKPFELNAKPYESLEAALRALLAPERLDGTNQYWCSHCESKQDADRGCAFHKMPYLLTLQLMRFTFDPATLNRIKLNDKFTFPLDRLDLSDYITPHSNEEISTNGVTEQDATNTHTDLFNKQISEDHNNIVDENIALNGNRARSEDGLLYRKTRTFNKFVISTGEFHENVNHFNRVNAHTPNHDHGHKSDDQYSEAMETETVDSGVNSNTDSPYDGVSSGSPTVGSPNVEEVGDADRNEELVHPSDYNLDTLNTVTSDSVLMKAVLSVQQSAKNHCSNANCCANELDDGIVSECTCSSCSSGSAVCVNHNQCKLSGSEETFETRRRHRSLSPTHATTMNTTNIDTASKTPLAYSLDETKQASKKLIYELFSIMVHSGSINGGHYYAYIKSFTDDEWYKFNDQCVTRTTRDALEATFGCSESYMQSSNAYFLMYRLVDPGVNETFLSNDEFPEHIKQLIEAIRDEELGAAKRKERAMMACRASVYTRSPIDNSIFSKDLTLYKDQTLIEASNIARETLLPDWPELQSPRGCRLVHYSTGFDTLLKSEEYVKLQRTKRSQLRTGDSGPLLDTIIKEGDNDEEVTVGEFLHNHYVYPFNLWLEHRENVPGSISKLFPGTRDQSQWDVYEPQGIKFHVSRIDLGNGTIYPRERMCLSLSATIRDLISTVWKLYAGQIVDASIVDPITTLQLILDQTNCSSSWKNLHNYTTVTAEQFNLPDWVLLLHQSFQKVDDKNLQLLLIDQRFDTLLGLSDNQSNSSSNFCSTAFTIYVDLGLQFDNYVDPFQMGDASLSADSNDMDDEFIQQGLLQTNNTNSATISVDRLHRMCALVENKLYHLTLQTYLPSKQAVASFLIQRELLMTNAQTSNWIENHDQYTSATDIDDQNLNVKSTVSHMSDYSSFHEQSKFSDQPNLTSSPNSHCSTIAHCGSLYQDQSQFFAENSSRHRRSNSQPCFEKIFLPPAKRSGSPPLSANTCPIPSAEFRLVKSKLGRSMITMEVDDSMSDKQRSSLMNHANNADDDDDILMDCATNADNHASQSQLETTQSLCCSFDGSDLLVSSGQNSTEKTRVLDLHLDKRLSLLELKSKIACYLQLDAKFINIHLYRQEHQSIRDLYILKPDNQLSVSLVHCVNPGEIQLSLFVLDLTGSSNNFRQSTDNTRNASYSTSVIWNVQLGLICRIGWCVEKILNCASAMLKFNHNLHIPLRNLRLRKCSLPDLLPGPIYKDSDVLTTYVNQHQALMLQIIDTSTTQLLTFPTTVNAVTTLLYPSVSSSSTSNLRTNNTCSLFIKRWRPSTLSFDSVWFELVLGSNSVGQQSVIYSSKAKWQVFVDWLVQYTGLPAERLAVAHHKFPGIVHCLNMIDPSQIPDSPTQPSVQWFSCVQRNPDYSLCFKSGNVVFFKDISETCKVLHGDQLSLIDQKENDRLQILLSLWKSHNIPLPAGVWDADFVQWSLEPRQSELNIFCPPLTSDYQIGCALPYLPFSGGSQSAYNFSTHHREQPLRIYTAEDVPSVSSGTVKDKLSSTQPASPKLSKSRCLRTP